MLYLQAGIAMGSDSEWHGEAGVARGLAGGGMGRGVTTSKETICDDDNGSCEAGSFNVFLVLIFVFCNTA